MRLKIQKIQLQHGDPSYALNCIPDSLAKQNIKLSHKVKKEPGHELLGKNLIVYLSNSIDSKRMVVARGWGEFGSCCS